MQKGYVKARHGSLPGDLRKTAATIYASAMSLVSCSWCGHSPVHATDNQVEEDGVKKCTGCRKCYRDGNPPPPKPVGPPGR